MPDQIQRFVFDDTAVRGEIVQLEAAYRAVLECRDYPAAVQRLLGELMAACALLTATVKLDGTLAIELRGKGAVSLLMAESNPANRDKAQCLRAVARYDEHAIAGLGDDASLAALTGEGRVLITLTPRHGKRYQGIVALDQPNVAACIETYFAQSEQLPTRVWLAADEQRAAGLLIQKLPGDTRRQDWERLHYLADTITPDELTGLDADALLYRLFHEERARVFEPAPVIYRCSCSRERYAAALHRLGAQELRSVVAEQGQIETQCLFCNACYVFSAADVERIIEDPDITCATLH